jgi:hypothetical protein
MPVESFNSWLVGAASGRVLGGRRLGASISLPFSNFFGEQLTNKRGITINLVYSITLTIISHKYFVTQIKILPTIVYC